MRVVVDDYSSDLIVINVPRVSVISATLFLLHINDLLPLGVVGYADDSTVSAIYFSSARASRDETTALKEAMVERMNLTLNLVVEWGDDNLVKFNASKTQLYNLRPLSRVQM